jgi:hypothetical protein
LAIPKKQTAAMAFTIIAAVKAEKPILINMAVSQQAKGLQ